GQAVRAALPDERARFHQPPRALLDEEGIAALDQQALERLQPRVVAQEGMEELDRTLGRERVEAQLAVVGLASPAMLVLGPVVGQEERPGRGQALDQAVEQGLRFGVDPLQVLNEQQERLNPAFVQQETLDRILDLPALLRWIEISPRRIVDGEVQQREQRRDEWFQSLVAGQNRLRDLSADHLRLIGV